MWALLAHALRAASAKLAMSPVARKKLLQVTQKAGKKFQGPALKARQFCKQWPDNHHIRKEYNARKPLLRKELDRMRRQGASPDKMARHAYAVRREARMSAREKMRRNGDVKGVKDAQALDLKNYGNKNGPTMEYLKAEKGATLKKKLGRPATADEVNNAIVESATRTNVLVNVLYLAF